MSPLKNYVLFHRLEHNAGPVYKIDKLPLFKILRTVVHDQFKIQ